VQMAEANCKKRFSVVEGIRKAELTSIRPIARIEHGKFAGGDSLNGKPDIALPSAFGNAIRSTIAP
jgi:hypothetical protein